MSDAGWEILESGTGSEVLVAIPGAMGTADVFAPFFAVLPAAIRAIAASPPALPDAAELAAGLVRLLAARGVTRATLLGTSFGGYVAQFVALQAPDLVAQLVLANTFADPRLSANPRDPAIVAAEDASVMHDAAVKRVASGADTPVRSALLAQLAREAPEVLKARALALARGAAVGSLALDDGRIGLIDTADDPVISPAMRADLSARYPQARHITLPAGGHYPYLADPGGYASAVMSLAGSGIAR